MEFDLNTSFLLNILAHNGQPELFKAGFANLLVNLSDNWPRKPYVCFFLSNQKGI
jgi:hypothetical protein